MIQEAFQDPGSFRDPDGYVVKIGHRVFRALRKSGSDSYAGAKKNGLLDYLEQENLIIESWEPVKEDLPNFETIDPSIESFLEQQKIPVFSYPFEWSFDMLKDAAIHSLDLLLIAAQYNYVLKDSSAYNIQFLGSRPIFIDIPSISPYVENEPWVGYTQFCQHFLFPLLICASKDIPFSPLLKFYLNGIPVHLTRNILGIHGLKNWGVLKHVALQSWLQRNFAEEQQELKKNSSQIKFALSHVISLAKSMRKCIQKISRTKSDSAWSNYQNKRIYEQETIDKKKEFVRKHLERLKPQYILDLGCNTGEFSLLGSQQGAYVVAIDSDEPSINQLYLHCKHTNERGILPIVMDITNPTPPLGWQLSERQSMFERFNPDCVFMLALIHHLCLASNIGWKQIFSFLERLGAKQIIVEFVPKSDPMAIQLLANRKDVFDWYTEDQFIQEAAKNYYLIDQVKLPKSDRTVVCLEKRTT